MVHGAAVGAKYRRENRSRDGLTQRIGLLRPLHQGANDRLRRVNAAEEIQLGFRGRLNAHHRRMTRMRHEIGEIARCRQFSGIGRRGVQTHDHRSRTYHRSDLMGHLSYRLIGYGKNHDVCQLQSLRSGLRLNPELG